MGYKQEIEKILQKTTKSKRKHRSKDHSKTVQNVGTAATIGTKTAATIAAKGGLSAALGSIVGGSATAAAGGTVVAGTATAAAATAAGTAGAAGIAGTAGTVAAGTAVAAPPFSTILAIIPLAVAGIAWGASAGAKRRSKILNKDAKLIEKWRRKYAKKSRSTRKKLSLKYLSKYKKHLKKGSKKTAWPFDGNKRVKAKASWRAEKSELEMRMRAIYAAQFGKSFKKKTKKKVSKKLAKAEKKVVHDIKTLQKQSIDPRTSNFPLLAGGLVCEELSAFGYF